MSDYHHMSYNRVGRRGFRLKYPKRFSVQRFLSKWRCSYRRAAQFLKKVLTRNSVKRDNFNGSGRKILVMDQCRLRSYARSNSFYSEAIADCLEFIKRSSVSVDDHQNSICSQRL